MPELTFEQKLEILKLAVASITVESLGIVGDYKIAVEAYHSYLNAISSTHSPAKS